LIMADPRQQKRRSLKERLRGEILVLPGAFNAATALLVERCGFDAVYISGAGLANSMGVPDIGLLTLTEVLQQARMIADAVSIPAIADADTGYGEGLQIIRTVQEFEQAGLAGIHLEDQQSPKRCGHLPGKEIVSAQVMARRIRAAVSAREDPDFLIIARTDARAVEGLEGAIDRAHSYRKAGADVIFPEALESAEEFETFARRVPGPLMANMTEFGKSPYLTVKEFEEMGYRMVIFPMTAFRVMMKSVEDALRVLKETGTQQGLLGGMQTRQALYDLLRYTDYEKREKELGKE
jgi:methylisocitrate lyase